MPRESLICNLPHNQQRPIFDPDNTGIPSRTCQAKANPAVFDDITTLIIARLELTNSLETV